MHRVRIVLSTKPLWMSTLTVKESNSHCGLTRLPALLDPSFHLSMEPVRRVHRDAPLLATAARELEPNFFSRIWSKIGLPDAGKYRRRMTGYLLYEEIVKKITYMHFFEDLKMADTFYSWFVITELHVWMLMLRYMAEGKNGQEMRNNIVEAMWSDVNTRKSKLEMFTEMFTEVEVNPTNGLTKLLMMIGQKCHVTITISVLVTLVTKLHKANVIALKKQISDLSSQFNAAVIGYDEGIMSDDKILAAALWRRCYQCECSNPESVEKLVHYVRKQVNALDHLPKQDIMDMRSISWLDYKSI